MGIANQLEQVASEIEGYDGELKEQLDEIWDDIYDVIIYYTIPKSVGMTYTDLMKAVM
jgi:hypothetical protein